MRRYSAKMLIILGVITSLFLGGCGSDSIQNDLTREKYFKSDATVTFYRYNLLGQKALEITGKPFMIVKYLRISNEYATDCYFGLSEVVETDIPGVAPVPHDTFLKPANIEAFPLFNFPDNSPILLPVVWDNKRITSNSGNEFSFEYYPTGHYDDRIEEWKFVFDSQSVKNSTFVIGAVRNIDFSKFRGIDSDLNSFRLDTL